MSDLEKVLRLAAESHEKFTLEEEGAALVRLVSENLDQLAVLLSSMTKTGYAGKGDKRHDDPEEDESDHDDIDDDADDDVDNQRPGKKKSGNRKKAKAASDAKSGGEMAAKCSALILESMIALANLEGGEEVSEKISLAASAGDEQLEMAAYKWLPLKQFEAAHPFKNNFSSAGAKPAASPKPPAAKSGAVGASKTPGPVRTPAAHAVPGSTPRASGSRFSAVQHKNLSLHQWHEAHLAHLAHLHAMHLEHMERMAGHA